MGSNNSVYEANSFTQKVYLVSHFDLSVTKFRKKKEGQHVIQVKEMKMFTRGGVFLQPLTFGDVS
jgi:hypothetical protein